MKTSLLALVVFACGACAGPRPTEQVANEIAAAEHSGPEARAVIAVQREARRDGRIREAYELGQLQATKALHQAINNTQNSEKTVIDEGTLVPLTIPERKIDGVIINPGVEYVRLPH